VVLRCMWPPQRRGRVPAGAARRTGLESHRNKFICNGRMHTSRFSIDTIEKGSKGTLRTGTAWVQFCVTKGQEDLVLSKSGWVRVVVV
jgi:hypothetical protein